MTERAITIGFSTKRYNPMSAIIRLFTKSKASHSWMSFEDEYFGRVVLESTWGGFRLVSYDEFKRSNTIVGEFDTNWDLKPGLKAARDWLGTPYDTLGLFGNILVVVGRWFKQKWKNPLRNAQRQFCSEAIARILQASNFPGTADIDPESTFPQDLYDLMLVQKEKAV